MTGDGVLRFGIIGFGKMGRIRAQTIGVMDRADVAWVCDVGTVDGVPDGARLTADPDEVLADPSVDAVVVSTSNDRIRDLVVAGLGAGKHVFAEKPPGRTVAEVEEMAAAEATNPGHKLMFGFNHRHHDSMVHAKRLIDSGEYGPVLWMRGRYGKSADADFFESWRAKKELAGGGILLDQGIHLLDLFVMMAGDFDQVKADVSNLYWHLDIEDNVFAIYKNTKTGVVASLHSTMTQWRHIFSLEIFLERGYMVVNGLKTSSGTYGDEVLTIAKNRTAPPEASWTDEEKLVYHIDTSWQREMAIFAECVREDRPVPVGGIDDARRVMRLIEATYADGGR